MNIEEGKEEPWKRGKVKLEQREREMTNEVEKDKPRKNLKKRVHRALAVQALAVSSPGRPGLAPGT